MFSITTVYPCYELITSGHSDSQNSDGLFRTLLNLTSSVTSISFYTHRAGHIQWSQGNKVLAYFLFLWKGLQSIRAPYNLIYQDPHLSNLSLYQLEYRHQCDLPHLPWEIGTSTLEASSLSEGLRFPSTSMSSPVTGSVTAKNLPYNFQ